MPPEHYDYLIIGQGLAGSLLAFELIQRGQRVLVVDNKLHGSSSQVAAGLINPITGHRLNLSDGFSDFLNIALPFYNKLEKEFGGDFIRTIEQRRLIKNPGQAEYFKKRCAEANYAGFLSAAHTPEFRVNDFGTAAVHQSYVVDTKALLASAKKWLIDRQAYLNLSVDYTTLISVDNTFSVNGLKAQQVVFCEGFQAIHNPWLKDLPFKLSKGEILTLELNAPCSTMLSWGNWLVPHTPNTAKLGANYAWEDTSLEPSESVNVKLMQCLTQNTCIQGRVINHEVGVRPTTKLRKALVGPLSNLENAHCFNGFGSKGCLTIPKHVQLLCDFLLERTALPSEISQCL